MDLIKNWKLHLLALLIVIVAESIGMKRFDLIIFLPLFYALIIGGIISYPNFKILKLPEMERASRVLSVGMLILVTKLGLDIGRTWSNWLTLRWLCLFRNSVISSVRLSLGCQWLSSWA